MNLVMRFLIEKGTRGKVGASEKVGALFLLTLDFLAGLWLANSSYSLIRLVRGLMQKLCQA